MTRWRSGPAHWGAVARLLHWNIALMIVVEVPAGFVMVRTYRARAPIGMAWHYWASNVHHTGGILILVLALLHAGWRLTGPIPAPPATLSPLARAAARATHWLLYALLILIPLSGWAMLSALADSAAFGRTIIWIFGTNGFDTFVPRIAPPVAWDSPDLLNFVLFARTHHWLLIAGTALLALHVVAALRHHYLLRDATLRRMLTGEPIR